MDDSALSFAYSLEGEHATNADLLRREAYVLEREAQRKREQADREDQRARWAHELADALNQTQRPEEGRL